jgi:hypothetical protein
MVLHGNAAGNPSFGAVALTTDISGTLPVANGGTGAITAGGALATLGAEAAGAAATVQGNLTTHAGLIGVAAHGLGTASTHAAADFDVAGAAAAVAGTLSAHTGLTTSAHGGIVASSDARLSDARPASDVSAWAKAGTKPTYTYSEVGALAVGGTAADSDKLDGQHGSYYLPVYYNVLNYGAVADAKWARDAAINVGSNAYLLTSASSSFSVADIGKSISITGAGPAGAVLVTTISGCPSGTTVTLTAAASTSVSAQCVAWGTDNTPAFTSALAAAGSTPAKGRVHVPAGSYRINTNFAVGTGVGFSGIGPNGLVTGLSTSNGSGTVLHLIEGAGSPSGTPAITVMDGAFMEGFSLLYPNQTWNGATPITYPFAIQLAPLGRVEEIMLWNPYQGIDASTGAGYGFCSLQTIRRIWGQPLLTGIVHDKSADISRISDIHFWPYWTQGWGNAALEAWQLANGTAISLGYSDGLMMDNVFLFNYNIGIRLSKSSDPGFPDGCYGSWGNISVDKVSVSLYVECTNHVGVTINGFMSGATSRHVHAPSLSTYARVTVLGGTLWDGFGTVVTPIVWASIGDFIMSGVTISGWNGAGYAFNHQAGTAIFTNNRMIPTGSSRGIAVAGGISTIVMGNMMPGCSISGSPTVNVGNVL